MSNQNCYNVEKVYTYICSALWRFIHLLYDFANIRGELKIIKNVKWRSRLCYSIASVVCLSVTQCRLLW